MPSSRIIHDGRRFSLTIERLCRHLIEEHGDFQHSCLIGIQQGGARLADRLAERIADIGVAPPKTGKLDITFYRDDFRTRTEPLKAYPTEIDFLVEGKRVILVDDVLYSGRTTVSAMNALQHYGRPAQIELLVLVDRRFKRSLPIQADYRGLTVDSLHDEYVTVAWKEDEGEDQIILRGN